jgi:hypothetical protein
MTIALPPQLEAALHDEAQRRGTTPEALAAHLIQAQLSSVEDAGAQKTESQEGKKAPTLWDRWRKHIEAIEADPTPRTGPTNLSQDSGRRFAELLEEKRRQGRL